MRVDLLEAFGLDPNVIAIRKGIAGKIAVETDELEMLIFTRPKVGYMLNVGKEDVVLLT